MISDADQPVKVVVSVDVIGSFGAMGELLAQDVAVDAVSVDEINDVVVGVFMFLG